ncbi:bifunctional RecB family nuclease/DEAD/DEAH box helicase [Candidatus Viridilinea mediisalina]|uniref:AAA+ ATPase domain-containing protein n=1 Tax=Candidatus Viridilinea mediisalina TaxID=2024553 RepID=A0A2A6RJW9_9CHLR|nr:AAA domain-containing protein [Candidatus Viridilinea mediisalina]PDW03186.1 hypothetical protein CJ255_10005 [Candidatus Viridilinea mediisalina]
MTQKFHLTASIIVSHFKHRCDRRLRWGVVAKQDRGKPGLGWNVPAHLRSHNRPGIGLLMAAGDAFELERVQALEASLTTTPPLPGLEQRLHHAGLQQERGRTRVVPLPLNDTIALLRQPTPPRFIAQVDINLANHQAIAERFLRQFGLDPNQIELGVSRPDLLELLPATPDQPQRRVRVWDFKGSQVPRHEHYIQVAFYTLLLEAVLAEFGLPDLVVDPQLAVIEARRERTICELAPYRLALSDFLCNRLPALLALPAAEAHFHVHAGCTLCEYLEECRTQANAAFDLSRLPYISSESKHHLLAAGVRSHTDLVGLDPERDQQRIEQLRQLSHDLASNLVRYLAAAQALHDGTPRLLATHSFQMPAYEDVRVVISAEQDGVTGTCFALGLKSYEGWDEGRGRPLGQEHVFIAEHEGDEVAMLLPFLQTLNRLLEALDAENEAQRGQPLDSDPRIAAAAQTHLAAQTELADFKQTHAAALRKRDANATALRAKRTELEQAEKEAAKELKLACSLVQREQRRAQKRLHFYFYDTLDLLVLKGLIERHMFASEPPELRVELDNLMRLFPPEAVLPDAETFRSIPATIVVLLLRKLIALPIPYAYDLREVAQCYQPHKGGFSFRTRYGFSWEHSNQIAFERIHDVWRNQDFTYTQRGKAVRLTPKEIVREIGQAVRAKLRASDAIIRRIKTDFKEQLLLRKEPFRLYKLGDPLQAQMLEALRIFTTLEVSHEELATKQRHTLPVSDRVASFVCLSGLRALTDDLDAEGCLWFTFDPVAADAKFEPGDFNLVLTPSDQPHILLSEIDGELFNTTSNRWRFAPYKVTLCAYDLHSNPPRVQLKAEHPPQFRKVFEPDQTYVLDRLFVDYNSPKVFEVLQRIASAPAPAAHLHALMATATNPAWQPWMPDVVGLEDAMRQLISASGSDPDGLLNEGQWQAWRGVFREPLTLVWGPPGTGKTHTIAHMLIGAILAARIQQRPVRVLVSAFTHHAINNVLRKVGELTARYGLGADLVQLGKLQRNAPAGPDPELPGVLPLDTKSFSNSLENASPCQIVGATVWALHHAMQQAGDLLQAWFDLILIDEASQMKLPDALIAFAASKASAQIILAGDDRQLPPIIHGDYPEEQQHLLSSVFAFVRQRVEVERPELEARILFQLEANFRMNEPLTAYPRDVLYHGRFFATKPAIRIATSSMLQAATDDLVDFLLHPERAVILVRYQPPHSYTARNPLEAALATQIVVRLRDLLIDQRSNLVYDAAQFSAEGVAILAPHRAQNSAIRQQLRNVGFDSANQPMPLVDTVDKLQGQERDVIIMSYGVTDSEYAEMEAEFLLSSKRFNVAATRARHKLIVLCADTILDLVPTDPQVLNDAMMLKEFRRYCDSGMRRLRWPGGEGEVVVQWKDFG